MVGITSFAGYVPRRRMPRSVIAEANQWFNPLLASMARGERAMANWDEDAVTMAVEACRGCLPPGERASCTAIYLASTTLPFADRQNAGIVAAALQMPAAVTTMDVCGSQRAATTALLSALRAAAAVRPGERILVAASDKRKALVASSQEMQFGDGAAAVAVGRDGVIAELIGAHAESVEFVDHFRPSDAEYDYGWEERWVRDEGYTRILGSAAKHCLETAGIAGERIGHMILPSVFPSLPAAIAKRLGIPAASVRDTLASVCGDTGVGHPLLMLGHALETAKPDDVILLLGFGSGCDALLLRVTPEIGKRRPPPSVSASLGASMSESHYTKLLAFSDGVALDKGMRAENTDKIALSSLYRNRKMIFGFVGGKCTRCGTAQYPKSAVCANPACNAEDSQQDFSYADLEGTIMSWSADSLTFTLDPPAYYGMLTFEQGGRLMADFTDCKPSQVEVGQKMRMVFRIKTIDASLGFKHYFWKAMPVAG
jgi:hydroxymethylglutaryl-CoA synthase